MNATPHHVPSSPESQPPVEPEVDYLWPFIGLGIGTCIMMPLVLSTDPLQRLITGLFVGGLPGFLIGLWYEHRRAKRQSK